MKDLKSSKSGFLQKHRDYSFVLFHIPTFYILLDVFLCGLYKNLHRRKHLNLYNHLNSFHISNFTYRRTQISTHCSLNTFKALCLVQIWGFFSLPAVTTCVNKPA